MSSAPILILGKSGQVGRALIALLGTRALMAGRQEADLLDPQFIIRLDAWLGERNVSAVINAAAHTQVDKAEGPERAASMRINGTTPGELAVWCKKRGVPLVHYSTDYVFDGSGSTPRREDAPTVPINAYGESKLAGERAIAAAGGQHLILRTSWVYDAHGKNFYTTILRLLHEKESLSVVSDQIGAPTYAPHLARATLAALEHAQDMKTFPSGLYHLCNGGEASWYDFAQAIFALARTIDSGIKCHEMGAIPTTAYPLPARRPLNSRLDCSLAQRMLGVALPHWEEGLKECINETYAGSGLQARRS